MNNSIKNTKPLLNIDWTSIEGETPFYVSKSEGAYYGVAVETKALLYTDLLSDQTEYLQSGSDKILDFYNKQLVSSPASVFASIPANQTGQYDPSGTFLPLRPEEPIKVLVTIPDTRVIAGSNPAAVWSFDALLNKMPVMTVGAYDEIQINTYNFNKRVKNIVKLLRKYNKEVKNFEGRVYNIDLTQQAKKVTNFAALLEQLVRDNKLLYSGDQSDLIMVGVDSQYKPLYAQINQGDGFKNLALGFEKFQKSKFVDSNTGFIYKHLDAIEQLALKASVGAPAAAINSMTDWETFLNQYIKFPSPIIEHSVGRPESPDPIAGHEKELAKTNDEPKSAEQIKDEEARLKREDFKKEMAEKQKKAKDWVGDNVLGNLDKTIDSVYSLEQIYTEYLDKIGLTYIVRAAMECLALPLSLDDLKGFLADVRGFITGVVDILSIPTVWLDDLIPTVDILGDIIEQVFWAIYEAVKKALLDMIKGIVFALLDACGDPCAANFGGIQIGALLQKGGLKELGKGLLGPLASTVGSAAVGGVKNTFAEGNFDANTNKFLNNLNQKVSSEQMSALTAPIVGPGGAIVDEASRAISSSPIGKFFDEVSSTLTCGETNNLLRGRASLAAQNIIKKIASGYEGLDNLFADGESVDDFFGQVGKLIDEDDLAAQMDAAAEFFPNPSGCLTDKEDAELRCAILKERQAPDEFCEGQLDTSRERALGRVNQLHELLENPNALQDALPPIYCTYDPETGKIIDGLVPRDHPSFMFMMDTTLDTSFAGVYNAFTYDVLRVPLAMKLEVPGPRKEIDRVIAMPQSEGGVYVSKPRAHGIFTSGYAWMGINPEFEMAVQQGHIPNPPYWKSPPWDTSDLGQGNPDEALDRDTIAQNALNGRTRTVAWNWKVQDDFDFSIPTTEVVFCPGMSGSDGVYANFNTGYSFRSFLEQDTINPLARERLSVDENQLEISVPNPIKTNLQTFGNTPGAGGGASLAEVLSNKYPSMQNLFGADRYVLSLSAQPYDVVEQEKFTVRITGVTPGANAHIYEKIFITDIPMSSQNVIAERSLNAGQGTATAFDDVSPKEKQFVEYLRQLWTTGEPIYAGTIDNLEKLTTSAQRPPYTSGFLDEQDRGLGTVFESLLQDQGLGVPTIRSLYEEILRDLLAMCLTQVGGSRLLEGNGNIFDLIDFAPLPVEGCPDPNLLNLEFIKDFIKEQYKDALCLERSLPNTSGLGDNRDNAFESAALSGAVRATFRLYAMEIVLKTLVTFSRLQAEDLDPIFYAYLREQMIGEIRAKGYLSDFSAQTLKAYNIVAARRDDLTSPETDPNVAFDFFVKEETAYAVKKLLKISGLTAPDQSVDNLLINDNLDFLKRGWLPEFEVNEPILARQTSRIQASYHVEAENEIVGIKDFFNGSMVLEKYIRVEPTAWESQNPDEQTGVFGVSDYWQDQWKNVFPPGSGHGPSYPQTPPPDDILGDPGLDPIVGMEFTTEASEECDPVGSTFTTTIPGRDPQPSTAVPPQHTFGRYFRSVRYGLRLVCKNGGDSNAGAVNPLNGVLQMESPSPALYSPNRDFNLTKAQKNKAYLVSDHGNWEQPLDSSNSSETKPLRFAFPIVCVEFEEDPTEEIITASNDDQFFIENYNERYCELLKALKETDEYKFMFEYCFPLKKLISLCVLYNATYILPFPGLNNVFANTKEQLRLTFVSMLKSGNYPYKDPHFNNQNMAINIANGVDLESMGLDYSKMALQFIFGIFKGLGEAFSPNIAIAKLIKDAMKMVGPALVSAVNKAQEVGNRANELANGDLDGDETPAAFEPITECDLPFEIPDLPMFLISLGLLPADLFLGLPGPPLTGLGMTYLPMFGFDVAPGNLILGQSNAQKAQNRCDLIEPGGSGPNLLNAGAINCLPDDEQADVQSQGCQGDRAALRGSTTMPTTSPLAEPPKPGDPADDYTAPPPTGVSTPPKEPVSFETGTATPDAPKVVLKKSEIKTVGGKSYTSEVLKPLKDGSTSEVLKPLKDGSDGSSTS